MKSGGYRTDQTNSKQNTYSWKAQRGQTSMTDSHCAQVTYADQTAADEYFEALPLFVSELHLCGD